MKFSMCETESMENPLPFLFHMASSLSRKLHKKENRENFKSVKHSTYKKSQFY